MVMEKTRDIAVLVSMGAKRKQVRRIFIYQGSLIGVIGTAIGLVLGYSISWAAGHYHLLSLSAEVYSIDYVPFAPRLSDALLVCAVAIGISFMATLYPSWSAASVLAGRSSPLRIADQILRNSPRSSRPICSRSVTDANTPSMF